MTEAVEANGGTASARGRSWGAWRWVPIVLALGVIAGFIEIALWPVKGGPGGPPPHGPPAPLGVVELFAMLSAIDCALLVALLAVYLRTYGETRAQFALGLVVFLAALLVETIASSPFVFALFGLGPGNLGGFLAVGAGLETVALVIFLALSLE